jgi:hypothetical protein
VLHVFQKLEQEEHEDTKGMKNGNRNGNGLEGSRRMDPCAEMPIKAVALVRVRPRNPRLLLQLKLPLILPKPLGALPAIGALPVLRPFMLFLSRLLENVMHTEYR